MSRARQHDPSKSIEDLQTLGQTFSVENTRGIVALVGHSPMLDEDERNPEIEAEPDDMIFAQLARRLNDAAQWWGWNERLQTSATTAMRASRAGEIAIHCARLLTSLRGPEGELLESLGANGLWAEAALEGAESGKNAVASSLEAIENLQRWASAMSARNTRQNKAEKSVSAGPQADGAFIALLGTLGGIFWLFWHREPRISRDSQGNTPTGPFFRFVSAILKELGAARSDEAIASAIRRNPTLEAWRAMGK